jgi:hypothetical protein
MWFLFSIGKEIEGSIAMLLMSLDIGQNQNAANSSSCISRWSRILYFKQNKNGQNWSSYTPNHLLSDFCFVY